MGTAGAGTASCGPTPRARRWRPRRRAPSRRARSRARGPGRRGAGPRRSYRRAQAEIAGVEAQRVAFPVQCAAADPARPFPLAPVGLWPPHGVTVQLPERRAPGILMPDVPSDVLPAPREVVPGTGLQDDDPDASSGELQRQDASGRAGRRCRRPHPRGAGAFPRRLGLRPCVPPEVAAPPGEHVIADDRPAPRRVVVVGDQVAQRAGPHGARVIGERAE